MILQKLIFCIWGIQILLKVSKDSILLVSAAILVRLVNLIFSICLKMRMLAPPSFKDNYFLLRRWHFIILCADKHLKSLLISTSHPLFEDRFTNGNFGAGSEFLKLFFELMFKGFFFSSLICGFHWSECIVLFFYNAACIISLRIKAYQN